MAYPSIDPRIGELLESFEHPSPLQLETAVRLDMKVGVRRASLITSLTATL